MAFVLGVFYYSQEIDQQGVTNINAAMFLTLIALTFLNMMAVVNVFCVEMPIFMREYYNGMYGIDVYFLSKQIAEIPVFVLTPLLYNAVFYWLVGLRMEFNRYVVNTVAMIFLTQIVVGFGAVV